MTGLLVLLTLVVQAEVGDAERAYAAGRFEEALLVYERALRSPDAAEGPLLYNLGNCAFRLRRLPEALLHYRRAKLRMPRDGELDFNLKLVEERLGASAEGDTTLGSALRSLLGSFTPGEILLAVGTAETLAVLALVLFWRRRAVRPWLFVLLLLSLAGAAHLVHRQTARSDLLGVVLEDAVPLRPEPHAAQAASTTLRAGEVVRIEERSDRWVRVAHARGSGWTDRAAVGVID